MKLNIKVIPKAKENKIIQEPNILKVYLTQVPEKGKANAKLIAMLAKYFKLPKSEIIIAQGQKSHYKTIDIPAYKETL